MRGVRFTKAEREAIDLGLDALAQKYHGVVVSIRQKLAEATSPKAAGVAAGPLEQELLGAARGKVVSVGSGAFARVSRMATQVQATPDDARRIGAWMATQKWLTGPVTIFTVLSKWHDWLARAKATAAPDGFEEGLGAHAGNVGPGVAAKRPATTAGRRAPGIG